MASPGCARPQGSGRTLAGGGKGIELAPSTEHNRLDSYRPYLKKLGVANLLATSDGIEMTSPDGGANHHNAFPLKPRPRVQNNGGPWPDDDLREQIRRLFEHDGTTASSPGCRC